MSVAVLAPVLRRPERAAALADSLHAASEMVGLFFLCSLGDADEIAAVVAAGERPHIVAWEPGKADWARKINWGARRVAALGYEWILLGADDLRFHPGWAEEAIRVGEAEDACVVGTNDLGNRTVMKGEHSTHPLVHRDYLVCGTIDDPDALVPEVYWHNWVDTEFVETAKARGVWAFAHGSRVEHLHPFWRKAEDDEVYRIGREHYADDQRLFLKRRALWSGG